MTASVSACSAKCKVICLLAKDLKSSWGNKELNSGHNLMAFGHPCPESVLQRAGKDRDFHKRDLFSLEAW